MMLWIMDGTQDGTEEIANAPSHIVVTANGNVAGGANDAAK